MNKKTEENKATRAPETEALNLNIYQRVNKIMEICTYVRKGGRVEFKGAKYSYVGHDDVSAKLHPLLVQFGVVFIPTILKWGQDGNRTWANVQVDFINIDDPEDRFSVVHLGFGIDTQDKGPGKAVSYATKYAMLKTFVLETGDDPEKDNVDHEPDERPGEELQAGVNGLVSEIKGKNGSSGYISAAQAKLLYHKSGLISDGANTLKSYLAECGIADVKEIPRDKFQEVLKFVSV